jgi:hypothetical protein
MDAHRNNPRQADEEGKEQWTIRRNGCTGMRVFVDNSKNKIGGEQAASENRQNGEECNKHDVMVGG